jgi:anti-sigma regulatory factor (Ser/Thr protein kinase)
MEVRASAVVLLPYTPSSVAVARRRLTADLTSAGIFEPAVGDAALVVSELLSNAIRHAAPLPGSRIRVTWTLGGDALRVAVSDAGGTATPQVTRPSPAAPGGRGLGIVESLSSCWGVQRDKGETTVWAVLAAPHVTGAAPRPPAITVTGPPAAATQAVPDA